MVEDLHPTPVAFQVPDEATKAPSLQKTNNVNREPRL